MRLTPMGRASGPRRKNRHPERPRKKKRGGRRKWSKAVVRGVQTSAPEHLRVRTVEVKRPRETAQGETALYDLQRNNSQPLQKNSLKSRKRGDKKEVKPNPIQKRKQSASSWNVSRELIEKRRSKRLNEKSRG